MNEFSHSLLERVQQNQGFTRGNQVFRSYTFTVFQHIPSNKMAIYKTTLPASSLGWCEEEEIDTFLFTAGNNPQFP